MLYNFKLNSKLNTKNSKLNCWPPAEMLNPPSPTHKRILSASNMLHFNAIVDEGRQGDKARFKSLVCQEHQAG